MNQDSCSGSKGVLAHFCKQRWLWQVFTFAQSRLSLRHSTCTKSHALAQQGSWHICVSREGSDKSAYLNSLAWAFLTVHELSLMFWLKNSKWLWSGYTTITNCRQTRGTVRKSHTTIMRHQEDKQSKQPALSCSSRWLQHKVTHKQNREQ